MAAEQKYKQTPEHFRKIKVDYDKAFEYQQHSDSAAALFTARRIAENICCHLVKCEMNNDPTGLQLDALIGKLISAKAVSPYAIAPLRTIQYYGNLGVHYQGGQDEIPLTYVQPCLYSLFNLVTWYFDSYCSTQEVTIPFPFSTLNEEELKQAESFRKTRTAAVLVIMFIDMVNSTATRSNIGEVKFEELRQQKKEMLVSLIEQDQKGKLVKDLGDGYLAIFMVPGIAVETALKIQEALIQNPDYQVRIGLDMGQVIQDTSNGMVQDVFGTHVNRAARTEALSDGGHILTSHTVWDSAHGWLENLGNIDWKKHGSYWLKGIEEPERIYEPYNLKRTEPLRKLNGKKADSNIRKIVISIVILSIVVISLSFWLNSRDFIANIFHKSFSMPTPIPMAFPSLTPTPTFSPMPTEPPNVTSTPTSVQQGTSTPPVLTAVSTRTVTPPPKPTYTRAPKPTPTKFLQPTSTPTAALMTTPTSSPMPADTPTLEPAKTLALSPSIMPTMPATPSETPTQAFSIMLNISGSKPDFCTWGKNCKLNEKQQLALNPGDTVQIEVKSTNKYECSSEQLKAETHCKYKFPEKLDEYKISVTFGDKGKQETKELKFYVRKTLQEIS